MREIGDATIITTQRVGNGNELAPYPEPEDKPGRKIDESDENEDEKEGSDGRARMKDQIGTKDSRNAPGRANHGDS